MKNKGNYITQLLKQHNLIRHHCLIGFSWRIVQQVNRHYPLFLIISRQLKTLFICQIENAHLERPNSCFNLSFKPTQLPREFAGTKLIRRWHRWRLTTTHEAGDCCRFSRSHVTRAHRSMAAGSLILGNAKIGSNKLLSSGRTLRNGAKCHRLRSLFRPKRKLRRWAWGKLLLSSSSQPQGLSSTSRDDKTSIARRQPQPHRLSKWEDPHRTQVSFRITVGKNLKGQRLFQNHSTSRPTNCQRGNFFRNTTNTESQADVDCAGSTLAMKMHVLENKVQKDTKWWICDHSTVKELYQSSETEIEEKSVPIL